MMNQNFDWLNFLFSFSVWTLAKIFVCFTLLLYVVFALVVVRQIFLMTETLNGQLELPLKTIGILHLLGAIFVLLIAIMTL